MSENKIDIEQMLRDNHTLQIKPKGYSMYPTIVPDRDYVIIEPFENKVLKRGAVILYRRVDGTLILHRIWKVKKDGIYTVGDNQVMIEGPLEEKQIIGFLTEIIRNNKKISVKNPFYNIYSSLWLFLRPFRNKIAGFVKIFKDITQ